MNGMKMGEGGAERGSEPRGYTGMKQQQQQEHVEEDIKDARMSVVDQEVDKRVRVESIRPAFVLAEKPSEGMEIRRIAEEMMRLPANPLGYMRRDVSFQ